MRYTLIVFIILISACSNSPQKVIGVKVGDEYYQPDQAASFELTKTGDGSQIVCEKHKKTGSNIKIRTCTTLAQKRLERKQAEDMRNNNSINNAKRMTCVANGNCPRPVGAGGN